MCGDRWIDKGLAVSLQRLQRPDFVGTHKSAVAGNIGHHDRRVVMTLGRAGWQFGL
jgi:hypothetical protein